MGKINSIFLRKSKGKLAGTTIYTTGGVTIQREIATEVKNPRTRAQMKHRVKLANLVNMYQVLKPFFKYAFENKKPLQSDYNAFVSKNLTASEVYLTKQEAAANVVIPAPYRISEGTLGINATLGIDETMLLGLVCADDYSISENTTIASFSQHIINHNPGVVDGMQLSLVVLSTTLDHSRCIVLLNEILIDSTNTSEKVYDYMPDLTVEDSRLCFDIAIEGPASAGAFVLSHTVAGKTKVSTENLFAIGDWEDWTTDAHLYDAINSYGESTEAFLDSNNAQKPTLS